jgi:hypothetical protein
MRKRSNSARDPGEYERLRADRRAAYDYLATEDEHWQQAFDAQRALACTGRHRAVGGFSTWRVGDGLVAVRSGYRCPVQ